MKQQIIDYLYHWAAVKPNEEACVFNQQRLSWQQLLERVESFAIKLLDADLQKGDRLAMLSPARNEYLIAYLATLLVGGIWYGMHPGYQRRELKYLVNDAKPKILLSIRSFLQRDFTEDLNEIQKQQSQPSQLMFFDDEDTHLFSHQPLSKEDKNRLAKRREEIDKNDPALIVFTSGTTGQPKGALLSHQNILTNIQVQNSHFEIQPDSSALIHFPINHVACSTELTIGSLVAGCKIIFMDKFHPEETLKIIQQEKISILGQIPTMYLMQFALPNFSDYDLSSIKTFIWSGSSAPEAMVKALQQTSAKLVTGYGMTEVAGFVTYTDRDSSDYQLTFGAGKIDPSFALKLVDKNRQSLAPEQLAKGEIGEIAIKGDCVMLGYWGREEQTAEVIDSDGWLYTGDMAKQDKDGHLFLAGRSKDMFVSGGFNIYPREIEAVIEADPQVAMVAVIAIKDPLYQEVGKALIVAKDPSNFDLEAIKKRCKEQLANFKIPKQFEQVEAFPMLANGKLDKNQLKQLYSGED